MGNVVILGVPVLIVVGEIVIDTDLVISVDNDGEALIVGVLEFVVLELRVAVCTIVFVGFIVPVTLEEADLVLEPWPLIVFVLLTVEVFELLAEPVWVEDCVLDFEG